MQDKIKDLIDQKINPMLASHGGGVELVKIEGGKVFVKLQGGCRGCSGARMTIKNGVERLIREEYPEISEVVDITDHA